MCVRLVFFLGGRGAGWGRELGRGGNKGSACFVWSLAVRPPFQSWGGDIPCSTFSVFLVGRQERVRVAWDMLMCDTVPTIPSVSKYAGRLRGQAEDIK